MCQWPWCASAGIHTSPAHLLCLFFSSPPSFQSAVVPYLSGLIKSSAGARFMEMARHWLGQASLPTIPASFPMILLLWRWFCIQSSSSVHLQRTMMYGAIMGETPLLKEQSWSGPGPVVLISICKVPGDNWLNICILRCAGNLQTH